MEVSEERNNKGARTSPSGEADDVVDKELHSRAGCEDGEEMQQPYKCTFCERGFPTAKALCGHMKAHRKHRRRAAGSTAAAAAQGSDSVHLLMETSIPMSGSSTTSPIGSRRKRKQPPTPITAKDASSGAMLRVHDSSITTDVNLLSRRLARRRICHDLPECPQPESSSGSQARRKRKADILAKSTEDSSFVPTASPHKRTVFAPLNLGSPSYKCRYCGALFWYEERLNRRHNTLSPSYNTCCKEGSVILPPYKQPPEPLHSLLIGTDRSMSTHFFENIRTYNSMFAITSIGVKVIDSINDGQGPYIFKISGQLCHRIGSLLPRQGWYPNKA